MPERISKTDHQYAGRDLSKGDPFEVEPRHVAILLRLGRIEPEDEGVEYITPDAPDTPEVEGTLHAKPPKPPKRKRKAA